MMTLNPEILAVAEAARERMLERQHELERARADLNHEIRRLHAAGGSLREISEKLGVSHQRVHQIVNDGEAVSESMLQRLVERLRGVGSAFTRFTDEARAVVQQSQEEASVLDAKAVEPTHLLLALAAPAAGSSARVLGPAGVTPDAVRAALEPGSEAPQRRSGRGTGVPFAGSTKKALELSLREAVHRGDDYIGSEHLLLGVLRLEDHHVQALFARLGVTADAIREALDTP